MKFDLRARCGKINGCNNNHVPYAFLNFAKGAERLTDVPSSSSDSNHRNVWSPDFDIESTTVDFHFAFIDALEATAAPSQGAEVVTVPAMTKSIVSADFSPSVLISDSILSNLLFFKLFHSYHYAKGNGVEILTLL